MHRITLKDKLSGISYKVTFRELSYIDAIAFEDEARRYQPPIFRSLFLEYVQEVVKGDPPEVVSFDELISLPEHLLKLLVDAMFERSTYLAPDAFTTLIESLGERSLTLEGTYDVFLYAHLGPQLYLELLKAPPHVRAQLIVMIEKTTGIRVKERFEEAVKTGKPVDLITTGASYDRNKRRNEPRRQEPVRKYTGRFTPEELPHDLDEMLELSKRTLDETLAAAKMGNPEKFSWTREAAELARFEAERERLLLEREKTKPGADTL